MQFKPSAVPINKGEKFKALIYVARPLSKTFYIGTYNKKGIALKEANMAIPLLIRLLEIEKRYELRALSYYKRKPLIRSKVFIIPIW